ncbi:hypothetical protein DPMN_120327 [Dreissena polymorpha]|uniref:Uncharacterized protein n=1 Tax=Dreissena polymorpha TaxID=45954 RepID=A0A9D4GK85_DREPO|nr:hypothetical protein DPMN_120327 [Dreissena polymorpha]
MKSAKALPSFNEISQSTSKVLLQTDGKTDGQKDGKTDGRRACSYLTFFKTSTQNVAERRTDGQTDRRTCDGLTYKQTDRLTDRGSANHKSPPVSPIGKKRPWQTA